MIELNKIYNENCIDTMAKMPENYVDMVITSPLYDDLRNYNGYEFSLEKIIKGLYKIFKKGGVVIWVVGDKTENGSETGTEIQRIRLQNTRHNDLLQK